MNGKSNWLYDRNHSKRQAMEVPHSTPVKITREQQIETSDKDI